VYEDSSNRETRHFRGIPPGARAVHGQQEHRPMTKRADKKPVKTRSKGSKFSKKNRTQKGKTALTKSSSTQDTQHASVASPKSTGGGGFVFEDDICAWMLASMLAGEAIFDVNIGPPTRLDFQTKPDGWFLDDVLVTSSANAVLHRVAVSLKSNGQFTAARAPGEFVSCIWPQWLHVASPVFDRDHDLMALISAHPSQAAQDALKGLFDKAQEAAPALFAERIKTPGWATRNERELFASFACPANYSGSAPDQIDTARLLRRLRFLHFDFGSNVSFSLKEARRLCQRCVRNRSAEDAEVLWNQLRGISAQLRPRAGSITLANLVDRLRGHVLLAEYPDYAADWKALEGRSQQEVDLISDAAGGCIRISRAESLRELSAAVVEHQFVVLLGSSGAGKSALAKALFAKRQTQGKRTLWLDAGSFDISDLGHFESGLRLKHSLAELLPSDTTLDPLLVLDGLDRLYSSAAFGTVAKLLHFTRQESPSTNWRIVVPCQVPEWSRVRYELDRAGAPVIEWIPVTLNPPKPDELLDVVPQSASGITKLLRPPKIASLLTSNLKMLDLVVRQANDELSFDAPVWISEAHVAERFWSREVDRGQDKLARGRCARRMAQLQADRLMTSVAVDDFDAGEVSALQSLIVDKLCVELQRDRIAFAHDLYGDWMRLRLLLNSRHDFPRFWNNLQPSPLWHRALRLLGSYILSEPEGVTAWRELLSSAEQAVVHDALLEAPIFTVNAAKILELVWPDLIADDGTLLRRLLKRFLVFATIPNMEQVAVARFVKLDEHTARMECRQPYSPYWPDVLTFLHVHRDAVLDAAPIELARIVEMWLTFAPKGAPQRVAAAELALMLGQRALAARHIHADRDVQRTRARLYNCVLYAAHEYPDDVTKIALAAAERVHDSGTVKTECQGKFPSGAGRARIVRGPWPDGPLSRVDECFQDLVLEGFAIRDLFQVRPAIAREVVLATLIEGPQEVAWPGDEIDPSNLSIAYRGKWAHALPMNGPFLSCLAENFDEGLELIVRFIQFAADRASEATAHERAWRSRMHAKGDIGTEVSHVALLDGTRTLVFSGDERMFGWSAGLGRPPYSVRAALTSLEFYFYGQLKAGQDISDKIHKVLERGRCVAFLGVLCDVGKLQKGLFEDVLRPLLTAPELFVWDSSKVARGRISIMTSGNGTLDAIARQFHNLPHRECHLRHLAVLLMMQQPAMRSFFEQLKERWQQRRIDDPRLSKWLEQLLLEFNLANYKPHQDPEHGVVLINEEAKRVQLAHTAKIQAADIFDLVTSFPRQCRTVLDSKEKQVVSKLDEMWVSWCRIRELEKVQSNLWSGEQVFGDEYEYANAIAGGASVLLQHEEWCAAYPNRVAELETAMLDLVNDPS